MPEVFEVIDQNALEPVVSNIFQVDYFLITVCTRNWVCLFGEVVNSTVRLNDGGRMIQKSWYDIQVNFPETIIDKLVIMPNHIHGILGIRDSSVDPKAYPNKANPQSLKTLLLPVIVEGFKERSTKAYINGVRFDYWQPIKNFLWENDHYQEPISPVQNLVKYRRKIQNDPYLWPQDEHNPVNHFK